MAGLRCPSNVRLRQFRYRNRPSVEGRSKWLTLLRKKLSFSIPNRFIPAHPDTFDASVTRDPNMASLCIVAQTQGAPLRTFAGQNIRTEFLRLWLSAGSLAPGAG